MKKIKNYFEYRKNRKIFKKNITKLGNTILPLINIITSSGLNIVAFATKLVETCGNLEGEELIKETHNLFIDSLEVFANKFEVDEERLYEIVKYIATLDKDDIKKILMDAQISTLHEDSK